MVNNDTVKIFGNDTDTLRILGNALASKTCNKIMKLICDDEMYANEISKKLGIQINLTLFHLNKLEDIGVVKVTYKKLVRKGVEHKHYKMIPTIFISISETKKEIHETGFLKRIFKDSIKFASIGIVSLFSFIITSDLISDNQQWSGIIPKTSSTAENTLFPLVVALFVLLMGVITERIYFQIKNKKKI